MRGLIRIPISRQRVRCEFVIYSDAFRDTYREYALRRSGAVLLAGEIADFYFGARSYAPRFPRIRAGTNSRERMCFSARTCPHESESGTSREFVIVYSKSFTTSTNRAKFERFLIIILRCLTKRLFFFSFFF